MREIEPGTTAAAARGALHPALRMRIVTSALIYYFSSFYANARMLKSTCHFSNFAPGERAALLEVNQVEVRNAVDQCNKEVANRFDFKGSDARVEIQEKEGVLVVFADDEFKLGQVRDVLTAKLAKRGVDVRAITPGAIETISGNKVKQPQSVRQGVDQELAKKIVRLLKDSKLKAQASIQGDAVRVSGAKKDVLQEVIALVRKSITDVPLQFKNYRD
jgi:uncharacterized protein YajQ (UPF0234 family)